MSRTSPIDRSTTAVHARPRPGRRTALRIAAIGSLAITGSLALTSPAGAQLAPPAVQPTITVTPTSVNAERTETASATATFVVPPLGTEYGTVRLSLTITQSDSTLTLDPSSISASSGLNCSFDPADPTSPTFGRVYQCEIANLAAGGTYSIAGTIGSKDPGGVTYPVAATVNAASSYTSPGNPNDIRTGPTASTTLTVLGTSVAPPPGLSITASCVNDVVTVVIAAANPAPNFLVNVGDTLDLEAPLRPPGTYELPAGGASSIRVRVLQAPDFTTVFDAVVPCTTPTPTTVARPTTTVARPTTTVARPTTTVPSATTAPPTAQLPETGSGSGRSVVAALTVLALGAAAVVAARRRHRVQA